MNRCLGLNAEFSVLLAPKTVYAHTSAVFSPYSTRLSSSDFDFLIVQNKGKATFVCRTATHMEVMTSDVKIPLLHHWILCLATQNTYLSVLKCLRLRN